MKKSDLKEGATFYVQKASSEKPSIFGGIITGEVTHDEETGLIQFKAEDIISGAPLDMVCIMQGGTGNILHAFSYRPLESTLRDAFISGMEELALEAAQARAHMTTVSERQKAWMKGRESYDKPENDGKSLLKPLYGNPKNKKI